MQNLPRHQPRFSGQETSTPTMQQHFAIYQLIFLRLPLNHPDAWLYRDGDQVQSWWCCSTFATRLVHQFPQRHTSNFFDIFYSKEAIFRSFVFRECFYNYGGITASTSSYTHSAAGRVASRWWTGDVSSLLSQILPHP